MVTRRQRERHQRENRKNSRSDDQLKQRKTALELHAALPTVDGYLHYFIGLSFIANGATARTKCNPFRNPFPDLWVLFEYFYAIRDPACC